MAAAAILDFQKFNILTVHPLQGGNVRHRAKFHQNQSNGCRDMAIQRFFQNGGRQSSWICENRIFQRSEGLRDPFCTSVPNFVKIGQTVFFKMAAAAILNFQKFEILTAFPL